MSKMPRDVRATRLVLAVALAVVLQTVYVNCLAGGSADEL